MRFKLYFIIEKLLQVKIYPCFRDLSVLPEQEFLLLCDEMRELTNSAIGSIPEYQCLLKHYQTMQDKLLVVHRNKNNEVDAFVSAVVFKSKYVGEVYHYGLAVVSHEQRHKSLPFRLAFASGLTFLLLQPLKLKYWMTSLSSALSLLSTIARTNSQVFPSPYCERPQKLHLLIAKEFNENVVSRCYISKNSVFDENTFIYRGANADNCFKKESPEKQSFSVNETLNNYYLSKMNSDNGDAILQIGYVTYGTLIANFFAFMYRIIIRKNIRKLKKVWSKHVYN